jgi:hypothetical protein
MQNTPTTSQRLDCQPDRGVASAEGGTMPLAHAERPADAQHARKVRATRREASAAPQFSDPWRGC